MLPWRREGKLLVVVSILGPLLSAGLAAAQGGDPSAAAFDSLSVYGPLGVVCLFLLWRSRERDHEHAAQLLAKDVAHSTERREAFASLEECVREGNETLIAIRHVLEERRLADPPR